MKMHQIRGERADSNRMSAAAGIGFCLMRGPPSRQPESATRPLAEPDIVRATKA